MGRYRSRFGPTKVNLNVPRECCPFCGDDFDKASGFLYRHILLEHLPLKDMNLDIMNQRLRSSKVRMCWCGLKFLNRRASQDKLKQHIEETGGLEEFVNHHMIEQITLAALNGL